MTNDNTKWNAKAEQEVRDAFEGVVQSSLHLSWLANKYPEVCRGQKHKLTDICSILERATKTMAGE